MNTQTKRILKKCVRAITVIALLVVVLWLEENDLLDKPNEKTQRKVQIDGEGERLQLTKHAQCRMDCRNISTAEIRAVLRDGKINQNKSRPSDRPCPSYAHEGYDGNHDKLRIVVARCKEVTKVVTVINLDRKFDCHCQ